MAKYIMRLDDASEKRNIDNWNLIEQILDKYGIKPLVGVIPHCEDPMMDAYPIDEKFWDTVKRWNKKGWTIALHGYDHKFLTNEGGINPVNNRSEFACVPLDIQIQKIRSGIQVFKNNGIIPKVFYAPAHTFDLNTIKALKKESDIRIISDTIASSPYKKHDITFVPQQTGKARVLPMKTITFCYHPNVMKEADYIHLENFIRKHKHDFISFPLSETSREKNFYDCFLTWLYFTRRR